MHLFKIITPSDRTEDKLEVTRWVVKTELCDSTWDDLVRRLQKLFQTRSTQFFISWFDGTDYCTIRDVQDLIEAMEFFQGNNASPDMAIRIYASPDKREHHTVFGQKPPGDEDMETMTAPSVDGSEIETIATEDLEPEHADPAEIVALADEVAGVMDKESRDSDTESDFDTVVPAAATTPPVEAVAPAVPVVMPQMMYPVYPYMQPGYGQFGGPMPEHAYPMMNPQFPQPGMGPYPQPPIVAPVVVSEVPERKDTPVATDTEDKPEVAEQEPKMEKVETQDPPPRPPGPPVTGEAATATEATAPSPSVTETKVDHTKPDKVGKQYIKVALEKLRSMGFTQDEKVLKRLIKAKKGNLNEIIDALNSQ